MLKSKMRSEGQVLKSVYLQVFVHFASVKTRARCAPQGKARAKEHIRPGPARHRAGVSGRITQETRLA